METVVRDAVCMTQAMTHIIEDILGNNPRKPGQPDTLYIPPRQSNYAMFMVYRAKNMMLDVERAYDELTTLNFAAGDGERPPRPAAHSPAELIDGWLSSYAAIGKAKAGKDEDAVYDAWVAADEKLIAAPSTTFDDLLAKARAAKRIDVDQNVDMVKSLLNDLLRLGGFPEEAAVERVMVEGAA
jgi:hypothetical protein